MVRKFLSVLLVCATALGFSACGDNDGPDGPTGNSFLDIVTVASSDPAGCTFTFRSLNDSPEITRTTTQFFQDVTIKAGTRILLNYIPESGKQFESGPVRVIGFTRCLGPTVTTAKSSNPTEWSSSPVHLASMWRAGQWLNMQLVLKMTNSPRRFGLVLDPATADSSEPELHIVFTPDIGSTAMNQAAYASFDIAEIWNKPGVEAIRVFYVDFNGDENSARITKVSNIKPVE